MTASLVALPLRVALALAAVLTAVALTQMAVYAAAPVVTGLTIEAPDRLTVGDPFRIDVRLEADAGTRVVLAPGALPSTLSLTETPQTRTRALGGGRQALTLSLSDAAFAPREIAVPPLKLRYRGSDGLSGEVETPPARVSIASVLPAGEELAPRDLKPQAELPAATPGWLAPALGGALLALVIGAGALFWLLRPQPVAEPVVEPSPRQLSPEDRARRALDAVAAAAGGPPDAVPFYATIATTVRGYLTERHGFPAFALTTTELQEQMVARGMDRWQARIVAGLLNQCDAVVYAHYRPAAERADADLTAAYEIVEMSRPLQAPPELVEVATP